MFEALKLFETLDVGVSGRQVRDSLLITAALGVSFLLRYRVGLAQRLITIGIDLGQIHCCHDLLAGSSRLHQLLVDFRRVDIRQQVALPYMRANVFVPAKQISIGAGVDRRLDIRLQGARQNEFLVGLFLRRMDNGNRGNCVLHGRIRQHAAGVHAHQQCDSAGQKQQQHDCADGEHGFARRRRLQLRRRSDARRSVIFATGVMSRLVIF